MNYDKLTKEQLLGIHKDTLEYLEEQEKEIERLNNIIKEIDNAFKYENLHNNMELVREIKRILINEYYKGVDKE